MRDLIGFKRERRGEEGRGGERRQNERLCVILSVMNFRIA
jgi:hypothetical protein